MHSEERRVSHSKEKVDVVRTKILRSIRADDMMPHGEEKLMLCVHPSVLSLVLFWLFCEGVTSSKLETGILKWLSKGLYSGKSGVFGSLG